MPPALQGRLPQRLPRMGTRAVHGHIPDAESYHMCLIPESIWVSGIRHEFMSFLEMGAAGSAPTVDIGEGSRLRSSNILDDGRGRQRPYSTYRRARQAAPRRAESCVQVIYDRDCFPRGTAACPLTQARARRMASAGDVSGRMMAMAPSEPPSPPPTILSSVSVVGSEIVDGSSIRPMPSRRGGTSLSSGPSPSRGSE